MQVVNEFVKKKRSVSICKYRTRSGICQKKHRDITWNKKNTGTPDEIRLNSGTPDEKS